MQNTAPAEPEQTEATNFWKPGRSANPDPARPRSSAITVPAAKPYVRAESASAYCRRWLSVGSATCAIGDWRIWTTAPRPRCSGVILGCITWLPLDRYSVVVLAESFEKQIGQRLPQFLRRRLR